MKIKDQFQNCLNVFKDKDDDKYYLSIGNCGRTELTIKQLKELKIYKTVTEKYEYLKN